MVKKRKRKTVIARSRYRTKGGLFRYLFVVLFCVARDIVETSHIMKGKGLGERERG